MIYRRCLLQRLTSEIATRKMTYIKSELTLSTRSFDFVSGYWCSLLICYIKPRHF